MVVVFAVALVDTLAFALDALVDIDDKALVVSPLDNVIVFGSPVVSDTLAEVGALEKGPLVVVAAVASVSAALDVVDFDDSLVAPVVVVLAVAQVLVPTISEPVALVVASFVLAFVVELVLNHLVNYFVLCLPHYSFSFYLSFLPNFDSSYHQPQSLVPQSFDKFSHIQNFSILSYNDSPNNNYSTLQISTFDPLHFDNHSFYTY